MNKKILISWILITTTILSSCWLKTSQANPEKNIKTTQTNVINNILTKVIAQKNVKFNWSLNINANTPLGWWKANLTYNGLTTSTTWDINLWLNWNAKIQWQNVSVNTQAEIILTLKKIYAKLKNIDAKLPDPTITSYVTIAKTFVWKWFSIENKANTSNYSNFFKKLNLKEQFTKYSIFKVNKKISNLKYNVSLNNKGLANIIYNIDKQADPKFSWNIDKMAKQIWESWTFTWVLNLNKDLTHFNLSGTVTSAWSITNIAITYSDKKFILSTELWEINLNTNWYDFDGYLLIKQQWIKVSLKWTLSDKQLKLNIWYNLPPITANINIEYNAQTQKNINVKIPKDAIDLQKAMWSMMWWASLWK